MSRIFTIFICLVAVAAVVFLCIYEPLTKSTREQSEATRAGMVMALDPTGVREIRIASTGEEVEIKRRGDVWQMTSKPKDRADKTQVEQLILAASQMEFLDRIDGGEFRKGVELNDFGLKNPKRKIEFRGDQNLTLFIGKDAANESRLYVRTSESKDVFLVPDDILKAAFPEGGKFRDRRLTDLTADRVDRLIVRQPNGEVEFNRDARGWRMVKPLNAAADGKSMAAYLDRLLALPIREFVVDDSGDLGTYGITEGKNEVTFFADGSTRHQTLRLGAERDGAVLAQFTARDSVYKLGPEVRELLSVAPDSFRDRRLLPLNPDLVDVIRITTPKVTLLLRRAGDAWELMDGDETKPASSAAVQTLFDTLATAQVSSYTPAVGDKLASLGLNTPVMTIDFLSVLSENTPETVAGEHSIAKIAFAAPVGDQVSARVDALPEVATVHAAVLQAIPWDLKAWLSPR